MVKKQDDLATKVGRLAAINNHNNNGNFNANHNNIDNNNAFAFGMTLVAQKVEDKRPRDLWQELCSSKNLFMAWIKARKHKTRKPYILEFEKNLNQNLEYLRFELLLHSYRPKPLEKFIIRDPKTRKIGKSNFRDRIVHHAICNVLEPIYEKIFIYDSYANRKGKGVNKAVERFECFKRKISKNNSREFYILKADIKHYFDNVDHDALINILKKNLKDKKIIWLIKIILSNHTTKIPGKGMPLGNLTSQFFANVYLDKLDQYIKHDLKIEFYIRYVDDFIILSDIYEKLDYYKLRIDKFLEEMMLELHPQKSKIFSVKKGIPFLGLRCFKHHKLLKKSNIKKFNRKIQAARFMLEVGRFDYDSAFDLLEGWLSYSKTANTFKLRNKIRDSFKKKFPNKIADKEINRWLKLKINNLH